jgi:hypothetical protein
MEIVYLLVSEDNTMFKIGKTKDDSLIRIYTLAKNWKIDFSKSLLISTKNSNGLEKTLHYIFQDYHVNLSKISNGFTEFFNIKCFKEVIDFVESLSEKIKEDKIKLYTVSEFKNKDKENRKTSNNFNIEKIIENKIEFEESNIKTILPPMKFLKHNSIIQMSNNLNILQLKIVDYLFYKMNVKKTYFTKLDNKDLADIFNCSIKDINKGNYNLTLKRNIEKLMNIRVSTSLIDDDLSSLKDRICLFSNIKINFIEKLIDYDYTDENDDINKEEQTERFERIDGIFFMLNNELKDIILTDNRDDSTIIDYSILHLLDDKHSISLYQLHKQILESNNSPLIDLKNFLKILGINREDKSLKEIHNEFILKAIKNINSKTNIEMKIKYYGDETDCFIKLF